MKRRPYWLLLVVAVVAGIANGVAGMTPMQSFVACGPWVLLGAWWTDR